MDTTQISAKDLAMLQEMDLGPADVGDFVLDCHALVVQSMPDSPIDQLQLLIGFVSYLRHYLKPSDDPEHHQVRRILRDWLREIAPQATIYSAMRDEGAENIGEQVQVLSAITGTTGDGSARQ